MDIKPIPRDPTPEERLFNIIREGKALQAQDVQLESTDAPLSGPTDEMRSKKAMRAMRNLADSGFIQSFRKNFFSLRTVNRALWASLAIFLVYLAMTQFLWKESMTAAFMQRAASPGAANSGIMPSVVAVDDLRAQITPLRERNLFRPWRPEEQPVVVQAVASSEISSSLAGRFKLSGIYMSENPEALLETVSDKKTYAVSAGSEIRGIKVKEVRTDGVLITDGQTEHLIQ